MIDLSGGKSSVNTNIRFKSPMLRSDLCDYSEVQIALKRRITFEGTNNALKRNKKLVFKNNAPFRSCISKLNNTWLCNV